MFGPPQRNLLRHKLLAMTLSLIKSIWTLLFCRASLAPRISTTRTTLTTLVRSTNSTHGAWPVAEPFEEWACRRSHNERFWFYRAWFHHKTLPWDHYDIEYYKSATGYFIDDRPASHWPSIFSRVWGTRGWQLVLSATSSLPIWEQCETYEAALRAEEERIAAEEASFAATQQLDDNPVPRRGQKRQAIESLEHLNVQYQIEALLHNFAQLDVSKVPMLQGLPAPQQEQLITGVVHTLTTYRDELPTRRSTRPFNCVLFGPSGPLSSH